MIKINSLNKSYPKTQVFSDFSLEIEKGKVTCILGESGSGKTTLLNVLAGLTDYSGQVDKVDCSYVFQTPNLFPNLTARQNLELVCKDKEKIQALAKDFRIDQKLDSYPKHLSGGQCQRVALLRGVLFDSQVLLMDEPFSSLDLKVKSLVIERLKSMLKEQSRTVLMVTHDIKEAVALADRIVVLVDGKIVFDLKEIKENTENQLFGILMQNSKEN